MLFWIKSLVTVRGNNMATYNRRNVSRKRYRNKIVIDHGHYLAVLSTYGYCRRNSCPLENNTWRWPALLRSPEWSSHTIVRGTHCKSRVDLWWRRIERFRSLVPMLPSRNRPWMSAKWNKPVINVKVHLAFPFVSKLSFRDFNNLLTYLKIIIFFYTGIIQNHNRLLQ